MKILVIAPHPDDEVIGCGATLKKMALNGHEIYRCIVTKAYTPDWTRSYIQNKKKEILKSGEILSIKKTFLLGYPTVKLSTVIEKELIASLSMVIQEVKPSFIFIPFYGDLHKDHQIVHNASLVVCRPLNNFITTILMYEILSETEWGNALFHPQWYEDISLTFDYKIKAMSAYKSELKSPPHPRSLEMLKILAKKRGSEVNLNLCEAFQVVRIIE